MIVGRFFGDLHVMDMGFTNASTSNLYELRALVKFRNGRAATIAHARANAALELMHDGADGAFVRHAALNALGHEFFGIVLRVLKVAIP